MHIPALAVHGGAGLYDRTQLSPKQLRNARAALTELLTRCFDLLVRGGSALEAVEYAVQRLEDSEYFNAGRGSVLNRDGRIEMDASIMDGRTGRAGAVALVTSVKNPVSAARLVMEHTTHVCLGGVGAEALAQEHGLTFCPEDYFITAERKRQWEELRTAAAMPERARGGDTVGAVAADAQGHVAAATSTGGMGNKLPGRIGDSPVIGAGTWAADLTCAVSGTGHGDAFLRAAFAHEVDAQMRLAGVGVRDACMRALVRVQDCGGTGGCVAVDAAGTLAMPFNTPGMYRGWIARGGEPHVAVFAEDDDGL